MKKRSLFTLLSLGLLGLGGLSLGLMKGPSHALSVKAEEEPIILPEEEPEAEIYECSVIVVESKNGTVTADKLEGHVDEVVTLNVKHDVFYLIESVSVNGTELVEDEEISGKYTFRLVEGENKIEAKFVVDQKLLGEMSIVMEQAKNKDWSALFSVENIVRLVTFLLEGGVLVAIVRYYIKDKRLEDKVEKNVKKSVETVVPDATKEIVTSVIKELIMPIFSEMKLDNADMKNALTVFSRCLALAQDGSPEAKLAITQELSSLKLGDQASIAAVKKQIEEFVAKQNENMVNVLEKIRKMEESNKKVIAESENYPQEDSSDDIETHPYE